MYISVIINLSYSLMLGEISIQELHIWNYI